MSIFQGLGRSLRWLRERQTKRQYQVAEAAGITKAMLSAYETGKQKPSLETLEKILAALGCDLNDLHNAVQIVNERPEAIRRPVPREAARPGYRGLPEVPLFSAAAGLEVDVYSVLGLQEPLPAPIEQAFGDMLRGFHRLLRYIHESLARGPLDEDEPLAPT